MKVQAYKKREKKVGHMKVHEKKRDKKKMIDMLSKRIYKWRETIQKEFPSTISIHVHILI